MDKDRISQQDLSSHRDNPPLDPLDFYYPDAIDEARGFLGRGAMEALAREGLAPEPLGRACYNPLVPDRVEVGRTG